MDRTVNRKIVASFVVMLVMFVAACQQPFRQAEHTQDKPQNEVAAAQQPAQPTTQEPTIEATPIEQSGQWKVMKSDTVTLNVTAPGAEKVKFLYKPIVAEGRYVELQTVPATDKASGKFSTQFKAVSDFIGDVWAEAYYPDGSTKKSTPLTLTAQLDNPVEKEQSALNNPDEPGKTVIPNSNRVGSNNPEPLSPKPMNPDSDKPDSDKPDSESSASEVPGGGIDDNPSLDQKTPKDLKAQSTNKNDNSDESDRSDKITGGRIEKASIKEGEPDIKITVNVPAFQLTLWQNGKEIKTYPIGVGEKDFPLPIDERKITEIIWNPTWIPPDKPWVYEDAKNVKPGEKIEASDPRNPLGKIKIPLGSGYLIHEARGKSDIGRLVSHGCIRMLEQDILDLAWNIIVAQNLPVSKQEIQRAKKGTDRMVTKLAQPVPIDINYDTEVIEGNVLHIYPDVYERNDNSVNDIRAELESSGVNVSEIDDKTLNQIVKKIGKNNQFIVNVSDVKAGQVQKAGKVEPLTVQGVKKSSGRKRVRRSQRGD
jgi:hypothetical protein